MDLRELADGGLFDSDNYDLASLVTDSEIRISETTTQTSEVITSDDDVDDDDDDDDDDDEDQVNDSDDQDDQPQAGQEWSADRENNLLEVGRHLQPHNEPQASGYNLQGQTTQSQEFLGEHFDDLGTDFPQSAVEGEAFIQQQFPRGYYNVETHWDLEDLPYAPPPPQPNFFGTVPNNGHSGANAPSRAPPSGPAFAPSRTSPIGHVPYSHGTRPNESFVPFQGNVAQHQHPMFNQGYYSQASFGAPTSLWGDHVPYRETLRPEAVANPWTIHNPDSSSAIGFRYETFQPRPTSLNQPDIPSSRPGYFRESRPVPYLAESQYQDYQNLNVSSEGTTRGHDDLRRDASTIVLDNTDGLNRPGATPLRPTQFDNHAYGRVFSADMEQSRRSRRGQFDGNPSEAGSTSVRPPSSINSRRNRGSHRTTQPPEDAGMDETEGEGMQDTPRLQPGSSSSDSGQHLTRRDEIQRRIPRSRGSKAKPKPPKKRWPCRVCGKDSFKSPRDRNRHETCRHNWPRAPRTFRCPRCGAKRTREDNLQGHIRKNHPNEIKELYALIR